jgi:hypothetical protein
MTALGLGMAVSTAPLTTTVMGAVEDRHAGVASGINNAVSRTAGMLAVALSGAVAVGVFGAALDARLAMLDAPPELRRAIAAEVPKLAEATVPASAAGKTREEIKHALDEAFVQSFRVIMLIAAGLALTSAICAGLTIDPSRNKSPTNSNLPKTAPARLFSHRLSSAIHGLPLHICKGDNGGPTPRRRVPLQGPRREWWACTAVRKTFWSNNRVPRRAAGQRLRPKKCEALGWKRATLLEPDRGRT